MDKCATWSVSMGVKFLVQQGIPLMPAEGPPDAFLCSRDSQECLYRESVSVFSFFSISPALIIPPEVRECMRE